MKDILKISQLSKSFGKQEILEDITFQLSEPKIIALVAPNGTGKTTFLNIIANLENADTGSVKVFGKSNKSPEIFYDMAYLQDNTILYEQLSGWDHLNFVAKERSVSKSEVQKIVSELGIESYLKKRVKTYSLGMKQHLLLAVTLIGNPKLILMDEPLNGLDPSSVLLVRNLIQQLHQKGVAIIISSHNLHEIEKITDDVYFLYQGNLLDKEAILGEMKTYLLTVDKIDCLKYLLEEMETAYHELTSYKLKIVVNEEQLNKIQYKQKEKGFTIFDVQEEAGHLETAYFSLFSHPINKGSGESYEI